MDCPQILLPSSKSISNRLLIIHALAGLDHQISNLSEAEDTQILRKAVESDHYQVHLGEGATTLRFALAYFCLKGAKKHLDAAASLKKRPLEPLLSVLEQMGCRFSFEDKPYQLPLIIEKGVDPDFSEHLFVEMEQSSQFASAIAMIGPCLKNGLKLLLPSHRVSEPYFLMTLKLMKKYGIQCQMGLNHVYINQGNYRKQPDDVEADWSGAAFFLAWAALQPNCCLYFPNLQKTALQSDEKALDFFRTFGLEYIFDERGMKLVKQKEGSSPEVQFDFKDCPDLFPAICMFCALKKIPANFLNIQHLEHKESNRYAVLKQFMEEAHVHVTETRTPDHFLHARFDMQGFNFSSRDILCTHQDHRIAMAYSLLISQYKIELDDAEVVKKSFPGFWKEFGKLQEIQKNSIN